MRKLNISLILILSFNLLSQSLDPEYLSSIPDEIKKDIVERNNMRLDQEKDVYRSIDKLSKTKKSSYDDEDEKLFGYNFFSSIQSSFMPINEPNLDDTYVLDFGDSLDIQLIGSNSSFNTYELSRSGSINLPDIGIIYLSGITLKEASSLIQEKIKQTYIGTKAFITLSNIRDVNVLVSGGAFNPGIYTVSGSSNILHILNVAGGIGSKGSYREIKLIRKDKVIETLDIYDVLIKGLYVPKNRLRSGDIIFVEQRKNVVKVSGAFKRPYNYEMLDDENLFDAISFANGLNAYADKKNIFLKRPLDGEIKYIPITNLSQFKNIKSYDRDEIFVRRHSFRKVEISGAVVNPSTYLMNEGDTLKDLIQRSGGFTQNAYPYGAIYTNIESKNISSRASEILYNEFLSNILNLIESNLSNQLDLDVLTSLALQIKENDPNGRVVVDLLDESSKKNTYIKNGDKLFIPEITNNIYIYGEVKQTGPMLHKNGANIKYYIDKSAGLKESADRNGIFILFPDGNTAQYSLSRNLFAKNKENNFEISPGSIIFVTRKINNSANRTLAAQAYATILGQIGVSLASISVLKD